MAIGSWRSGIPRPQRSRAKGPPPPPPEPPAGHPIWSELPGDTGESLSKKNESLRSDIREAAVNLKDPSAAHSITSAMDSQDAARRASGQSVKL